MLLKELFDWLLHFSPDGSGTLLFWGSEQKVQRTAGSAATSKSRYHGMDLPEIRSF